MRYRLPWDIQGHANNIENGPTALRRWGGANEKKRGGDHRMNGNGGGKRGGIKMYYVPTKPRK